MRGAERCADAQLHKREELAVRQAMWTAARLGRTRRQRYDRSIRSSPMSWDFGAPLGTSVALIKKFEPVLKITSAPTATRQFNRGGLPAQDVERAARRQLTFEPLQFIASAHLEHVNVLRGAGVERMWTPKDIIALR